MSRQGKKEMGAGKLESGDWNAELGALIALGRELVERGLVLGSGGNLSLRQDDTLFITRSRAELDRLQPDDFLPVDLRTFPQPPASSPRPSTETPMHQAAYHARPDARVVVHCHPAPAIAWAMQGRDLPACTPDFALYLGAFVPLVPYVLPGSTGLAAAIAAAAPAHPALLLGNHGILVTGATVAQARLRTLFIDETARLCLLAAAAGQLHPLPAEAIAEILAIYGRRG